MACQCQPPHAPPGGALACALGGGTLPPFAALTALVVCRVKGDAALLMYRVNGHLAYYTA